MSMKVSVIIPAYNAGLYIRNCMNSLLSQSLEGYEIICIDDASTDGTYDIIKTYEKQHKNVRVIRNSENKGAGNARNIGLYEAVGDYIIFVDADDTYHSRLLEKMYDAVTLVDADVAVCQANYYDKNGEVLYYRGWNKKEIRKKCLVTSDNRTKLFQSILYAPWNKLVRREFLVDNNVMFQDLPNANDVYYSMMVVACAKKISFVSDILVFYQYEREGNLSDSKVKKRDYTIWAYEEVLLQLKKRGLWSGDIVKSYVNDVLAFSYNCVVYSADNISNRYLKDYREKIMPLLSDEEVKENATSGWVYYNYLYLNGEISYFDNEYQLFAKKIQEYLAQFNPETTALWGAGRLTRKLLDAVPKAWQHINYIVDNDTEKQGKTIEGIEICSFESVQEKVDRYLVLNERFIVDVVAQVGDADKVVNMTEVLARFEVMHSVLGN